MQYVLRAFSTRNEVPMQSKGKEAVHLYLWAAVYLLAEGLNHNHLITTSPTIFKTPRSL